MRSIRLGDLLAASIAVLISNTTAAAQTFNSGSTGADGAFDLTGTPAGTTIEFNPAVLHVNRDPNAPLIDPERDNIFHFTTINVPSGVTVRMSAKWTNGPVYLLATGTVTIAGTLDLNGETGHNRTVSTSERSPAVPGPGGSPGGIGGNYGAASLGTAKRGGGPGGGNGSDGSWQGFGYGAGFGASATGTQHLVPLTGGSGGGGGSTNEYAWWGAGGGAGGGAVLIASSSAISVTGSISVGGGPGGRGNGINGCPNYYGGGGGGGSIRLVAPTLQGGGVLNTTGHYGNLGTCYDYNGNRQMRGADGRVRLEAFQHSWTYVISYGTYSTGSPLNSFVPATPAPSIRVLTVAGVPVVTDATGGFTPPDVTINSSEPVAIVVEARNVPPGTVPTMVLFALEAADQTITAPALQGTREVSTTTVQATLPPGFTRGYVRATW